MYSSNNLFALFIVGLGISTAVPAATITVDSNNDAQNPGGACTLRGAVAAVNGGANANGCTAAGAYGSNDRIVFSPALANSTITFGSQITLTKNLIIDGGTNKITLDGNNATRLLYLNLSGIVFSANGLTFRNGNAGSANSDTASGGAIYSLKDNSVLNLTDCVFENNSGYSGGAIFTASLVNVTMAVTHSKFLRNKARFHGGGIFGAKTMVTDSTFIENRAHFDPLMASGGGGAIRVEGGQLYASNSTFVGNQALNGAGIYSGTAPSAAINVSNSTFLNNVAENYGGAFFTEKLTASHLTLVNSRASLKGSTVFIANGGTASIANSLFAGDATLTLPHCETNTGSFAGSRYNVEWRNGADGTSCGATGHVNTSTISAITDIVSLTPYYNGGVTRTLALPQTSPAIGKADTGGSSQMLNAAGAWVDATLDQRGSQRKTAGTPRDIGAFEWNPLALLPLYLPSGTVGSIYNAYYNVIGGLAPYTYVTVDGELPPGLQLTTGGLVTGIPTQTGTYCFAVSASDTMLPVNRIGGEYCITVSAAGPVPDTPFIRIKTHADVVSDVSGDKTLTGVFVPDDRDMEQGGAVFIFAYLPSAEEDGIGSVWVMDSASAWHLFTDCRITPAYYSGDLHLLQEIPIVGIPTDLTPFAGGEVYIGYGLGGYSAPSGQACNDMIARHNWVKVFSE